MNIRKDTSCLAAVISFESCVKISGPDSAGKLILNTLMSIGTEGSSLCVFSINHIILRCMLEDIK